MVLSQIEPKKIYKGSTEIKAVYLWDAKVRPVTPPDYLCFTAEQANSTIKLIAEWWPTSVNLEISNDLDTWTDYTIWNTITLSSIWDKVYWRNKSSTVTRFSIGTSSYYHFWTTWKLAASWDVNYLLCKDSTNTVSDYCFYRLFFQSNITTPPKLPGMTLGTRCYEYMFYYCADLTTACELPATTLANYCYSNMFAWCNNLTAIPKLPATTLAGYCYEYMFYYCTKIKLSQTQTWDYTQPYRIPTEWTGTSATGALNYMFNGTWWTWKATPTINTTYYVHKDNTIV